MGSPATETRFPCSAKAPGRSDGGEARKAENPLEERRGAVANSPPGRVLPARLHYETALDEASDCGVGRHAADPGDVGARARAEVRHDGQRFERRLREASLDGPFEEPLTGACSFAARAEGVAACHLLEDDAAPPLAVALAQ